MKKRIIKWYYYFFYKMYKQHEGSWLAETKAMVYTGFIIGMILLTVLINYKIHVNRYFELDDTANFKIKLFLFLLLIIGLPHYCFLSRDDKWILIVRKFDRLPKRKNKIGGWVIFILCAFILVNLIYSYYQLSLIDWSKYRK